MRGGITAITTFVIADLAPLRRRAFIYGIGNVTNGIGVGLGGIYGGWINDHYGWRLVFLLQIPFIIVSWVFLSVFLDGISIQESDKSKISRVDFTEASLLVTTLLLLFLS